MTTLATNLAVTASKTARTVGYLDCDIEEPNGAIFLKPEVTETVDGYRQDFEQLLGKIDALAPVHTHDRKFP